MNRKGILFFTVVIIIYFLGVIINKNTPQEPDWSPTYDETGTQPLDTRIIFTQLSDWFKGKTIKKVDLTFYEYCKLRNLDSISEKSNYIHISNNLEMDESSIHSLLAYIGQGNNAFLSATTFPRIFMDSLNFKTIKGKQHFKDKPFTLLLSNTHKKISIISKSMTNYTSIKSSKTFKNLGKYRDSTSNEKINFIGIPYKKGIFYIHTSPEIFTNYQLLKADNFDYLNHLLSYLPKTNSYFNQKNKRDPKISSSPLRYVLSQPPLQWAWYLSLISIALFIIFNAKRRQRIIPPLPTTTNTTTEFVQTVSNLYQENEAIDNIVHKKINYFFDYIRTTYHLSTDKLDDNFKIKLASKSNNSKQDTEILITMISKMHQNKFTTTTPLLLLNKRIDAYLKK